MPVVVLANPANLADISGSTINPAREDGNLASIKANTDRIDVNLSTVASQATLASILSELEQKTEPSDTQSVSVASLPLPSGAATEATLATRATESTVGLIKSKTDNLDALLSTRATEATLATRATEATLSNIFSELQLKADLTETQPVSVTSLPLPTGAATAANQTTANASLSSIDSKTPALVSGRQPVDGSGVTQPISAASLPLPTGAATEATLSTRAAEHVTAGSPHAARLTDGTSFYKATTPSDTQPVSATSLPLPTGAATSALQTTGNSSLSSIDTKTPTLIAGSQPVTIRDAAGDSCMDEVNNAARVNVVAGGGFQYTEGTAETGASGTISMGTDGASLRFLLTDSLGRLYCREYEAPTFTIWNVDTAPANNKSMMSILNAGGSSVVVRLKKILLVNSATTAITGVITDFRLFRITGHSAGTQITPATYDTQDSLDANVTVRTGATIAGESTSYLHRVEWSSDEYGTGTLDQEGYDHAAQYIAPFYTQEGTNCKPITLRAGEGLTLKCATNTTAGAWDIAFVFTVE